MFIPNTERQTQKFNLFEEEEFADYRALISNPRIKIISEESVQRTETTSNSSGETTDTTTIKDVYKLVVYEECDL